METQLKVRVLCNYIIFLSKHWTTFKSQLFLNSQQLAALLITKQVVGNVKEALVPFVKQKVKEWKLKKQEAKAKKEKDEKEGKDKKSDKPTELDSPLMNQAEIESTMAEYEVTTEVHFLLSVAYYRCQSLLFIM